MFSSWSGRPRPGRPAARPALLRLEDRTVPATIAGTVYADLNGNGLFDAGDTPIASSPIELRNSGGMVINSGTTGPAGTYSFATDNTVSPAPATTQETATVPLTVTDFGTTVTVPQFDPSLGTLISVTFQLDGSVQGDFRFENLDSSPANVTGTLSAQITLSRSDESFLVSVLPTISVTTAVAPFDGVIDFGGASGRTFPSLGATDTNSTSTPPPVSDLTDFTGTGTVDLLVSAEGLSSATGSNNLVSVFNTSAAATVTVTYTYTPSNAIRPGNYTVVQTAQPPGFLDGPESSGGAVLPGSVGTDTIPIFIESPSEVSAGNNFGELPPGSLSGFVYTDVDNDGVFDPGEPPVPGVTVTLSGADDLGPISPVVVTTGPAGAYTFPNLRPGTYTVTESQPAGFVDGRDTQGTPGNGTAGNDTFSGVVLAAGVNGVNNNFGELFPNPEVRVVKLTNGTDNDPPPGVFVPVGSTVTFTYVVTNAGNVPLSGVVVQDDAGTPGIVSDDFDATFVGGDTNGDGLLDPGETWTFTASRIATPGQYTNVATASGTATAGGGPASATNPDNHFGAAPAITLVKLTNGTDNNAAPGVIVPIGTAVTFTYVVTNPGNVPLSGVSVADDAGTPGDPADDFSAAFVGGDINADGFLDPSETWTFTASRVATPGQYSNRATAVGTPPPGVGEPVSATDPDNHFGAGPAVRLVALTNARDNPAAPGPAVTVGRAVSFVYLVTNVGDVPLTGVALADDAGTPADPIDDLGPAFAGGDANGNGVLDPGEMWVFSASRVATAGPYTNVATVTALPPAGPAVTAADADHHFGVAPGIAVGAGPGASPQVKLLNGDGSVRATIQAFDPGFLGGVRVAVGDVTGDLVPDVIAGAGPGAGSHVKVFDGATNAEVRSFFAFPGFAGGVFVGAGDIDGDGRADIIVGAGAGGAPHVKVFSGATGAELRSFFAFGADFAGGVTVAGGDVSGDGRADVVVGAGPGAGPHVKVFDGVTGAEVRSFFAFGADFAGGVFVGAGDFDCLGPVEIVVGAGPGGGSHVKVFDGATNAEVRSFFAFAPGSAGGVRVAAGEVNAEGMADLILGAGTGSEVKALDGITTAELFDVTVFGAATQGVFVG